MRPAFTSVRQAAAFAGLLLLLITAPVFVAELGVLDRSTVYPTMPVESGPVSHIQRQLFEESGDLDVVFIGSSLMWSAIDAPFVKQRLSRALGRKASVEVIASVWPGLDRDYSFLRDLLARRRVGLVVLQFPHRNRPTLDPNAEYNRISDEPHVQAFRFYRFGEFDEIGEGLSWRHRAALYAGAVLGMPRHLLTFLRPNYTSPSSVRATLGARFQPLGFYGEPYVEFRPMAPVIDARDMIYDADGGSSYRFFDEPLPAYQMYFARRIAALLAEKSVPTVLLHIPQANEIDAEFVEERLDWIEATGIPATMVGIPPARLFRGFAEKETLRFFSSDHLNENGAIFFTRAIFPALLKVIDENEESD